MYRRLRDLGTQSWASASKGTAPVPQIKALACRKGQNSAVWEPCHCEPQCWNIPQQNGGRGGCLDRSNMHCGDLALRLTL